MYKLRQLHLPLHPRVRTSSTRAIRLTSPHLTTVDGLQHLAPLTRGSCCINYKQHHTFNMADSTTRKFFEHSSAPRLSTVDVIAASLKKQYPSLECSIIHPRLPIDLLGFAYSGHGKIAPLPEDRAASIKLDSSPLPSSVSLTGYVPPARRDGNGLILQEVLFDKFLYKWNGQEYLVYIVDGREGIVGAYPQGQLIFILSVSEQLTQGLIHAAGKWTNDLHEEIWVYDSGYWQKSKALYDSIRNASWDSVIMDPERKKAVIDDHMRFFDSRQDYERLKVPWKRGLIYYGPPGNGKTISIKAMMNQLYHLKDPIPTLYVRSLQSASPNYQCSVNHVHVPNTKLVHGT